MGKVSECPDTAFRLMTTGLPQGANLPGRRRILVVADEADVASLIRDNLITEGWEIFTTGGGANVLASVRHVRPDIVLLDITGPQFDGWEIYRQLKDDQETRAVRVIMIAGRFEQGEKIVGFEAGTDEIVILP